MPKKLNWIVLGILIGLCVSVFRGDIKDFAWAAASHMDRLVLGSGNYGTDPNSTADLTFQNDEYISNATDGTLDFGAANLVTTGYVTLGEAAHVEHWDLVSITAAQVKLLNSAPQDLVADPGDNYCVIFLDALFFLDHGGTDYDGVAAGEDMIISYTDGSGEVVAEIETDPFMTSSADAWRYCTPSAGADGADNAYIVPLPSAALVLSMLTGEIATGNSPLDIAIHYKIVPSDL